MIGKSRGSLNLEMALMIALFVLSCVLTLTFTGSGISNTFNRAADFFVAGVPDSEPPAAPTGVTAVPNAGSVVLGGYTATDNIAVDHYAVWYNTTGTTPVSSPDIPSIPSNGYTITGLDANTIYYIWIAAVDAAGNIGPKSSVVSPINYEFIDRYSDGTTWAYAANTGSGTPSLSSDARYVAFVNRSVALVPGRLSPVGAYDIYRYDRQNSVMERASSASDGTANNNACANEVKMSSNGRYIVFSSGATNLVAGDTNGNYDIFLKDMQTGDIQLVSKTTAGTQVNAWPSSPCVSDDGRYVCFTATEAGIVANDTNGVRDVFLRDTVNNTTIRISVGPGGVQSNGLSQLPQINAAGTTVIFESAATNLVANDTNAANDIFAYDIASGTVSRLSVKNDGSQIAEGAMNGVISRSGRYVAFFSFSTAIVTPDTNGWGDTFLLDRNTGSVRRVNETLAGVQSNRAATPTSVTNDGKYVVFTTSANQWYDGNPIIGSGSQYVKNMVTGDVKRVNNDASGNLWITSVNISTFANCLSEDGRYIVYSTTYAGHPLDSGIQTSNIYIQQLQ